MTDLQSVIEKAFDNRANISPASAEPALKEAVTEVIDRLDAGKLRVAEKTGGEWVTHQWVKKAVLLSFRLQDNAVVRDGYTNYFDKVPSKFADYGSCRFPRRRLPRGAAGGCAARRVHRQKRGADALIREHRRLRRRRHHGGHLGHGRFMRADRQERAPFRRRRHRRRAGTGAGQSDHHRGQLLHRRPLRDRRGRGGRRRLGDLDGRLHRQSTKIYNRQTGEILYGRIPPGSVVVSGNLPSPDGKYSLYCAVIVKQVDAKTRAKTSINELLRGD